MELVIVLAEIVISAIWIVLGLQYGFWEDGRPEGGFIGVIFGIIILIFALIMGLRLLIRKDINLSFHINKSSAIPVFAAVLCVVLIYIFGIVAAVFLFTAVWMRFISAYAWKKSVIVSLVFTLFVYEVFRLWLGVPFPTGILLELL
jgi:hypothetical protein